MTNERSMEDQVRDFFAEDDVVDTVHLGSMYHGIHTKGVITRIDDKGVWLGDEDRARADVLRSFRTEGTCGENWTLAIQKIESFDVRAKKVGPMFRVDRGVLCDMCRKPDAEEYPLDEWLCPDCNKRAMNTATRSAEVGVPSDYYVYWSDRGRLDVIDAAIRRIEAGSLMIPGPTDDGYVFIEPAQEGGTVLLSKELRNQIVAGLGEPEHDPDIQDRFDELFGGTDMDPDFDDGLDGDFDEPYGDEGRFFHDG